jgi:hypothetical protein
MALPRLAHEWQELGASKQPMAWIIRQSAQQITPAKVISSGFLGC